MSERARTKEEQKMSRKLSLLGVLVLVMGAVAAAALAMGTAGPRMGPSAKVKRPVFHGYYDGHKDAYLSTDVSDKAQAREMRVNFAPTLMHAPDSVTPEMYFVSGPAAAKQLADFASEPGESNYSPLWHETFVRWKSGVTPVLLKSDTQIEDLIKKGQLTELHTG